jgi:hypothetical protein
MSVTDERKRWPTQRTLGTTGRDKFPAPCDCNQKNVGMDVLLLPIVTSCHGAMLCSWRIPLRSSPPGCLCFLPPRVLDDQKFVEEHGPALSEFDRSHAQFQILAARFRRVPPRCQACS